MRADLGRRPGGVRGRAAARDGEHAARARAARAPGRAASAASRPTRPSAPRGSSGCARDATGYLQELWRDARIEGLVVDEGFPLPIIPGAELEREAGVPVHRVVRIEPWIAEERERAAGYDELEDALSARLEAAAAEGAVAFKSVIAYRTGLDIEHPSAADARGAFTRWRAGRLPRDARARQARA